MHLFQNSCAFDSKKPNLLQIFTPQNTDESLQSIIIENRDRIEQILVNFGAILFRGFHIKTPSDFNDVAKSFNYECANFMGGGGPRIPIIGDVYTSTETPPENEKVFISLVINFHHELAYLPDWPRYLLFYCQLPALEGGETPICSSNEVYNRVKEELPEFCEKVENLGIKYRRTLTSSKNSSYSNAYQRSWEEIFETEDKLIAETNARSCGHEYIEWNSDDSMIVISKTLPGIYFDSRSQKKMWLNALVLLTPELIGISKANSPWYSEFGDNSPIDPEDARKVLNIMKELSISFTWQQGDILMVDNITTMHSRNSFKPPRKTLVTMYK